MVDNLIGSVWQNIAPPKVGFMVWLTLLGKLNTKDMLVRKRMLTEESNYWTFCNAYKEDIDHVLVACPVSWRIWIKVVNDQGQNIANLSKLISFYEEWISRRIYNKI